MSGILYLIRKGRRYLAENGLLRTVRKVLVVIRDLIKLRRLRRKWVVSEESLKRQRETVFPFTPKISIIVPLYNTPITFLCEMLDSVCAQSYPNWQLCLADGSDHENHIEEIVRQYIERYPQKIKHLRLKKNGGISENTNACIDLANGDYLALLDHDDVLAPDALFEVVKVIVEKNADFVYTDETTFANKLDHIISVHFKPDFAIDNLRANNYICHFTVFRTSLLDQTGLFRKEYDGSQDHDMILRLIEVAQNVVHIPKVLYYWRAHRDSVASDINSKNYAINAGKKAVLDHIHRQGLEAKVESSKIFPAIYRIRYELSETPLVTILIYNSDLERISSCIKSILEKTTYLNFEIIIIDNGTLDSVNYTYIEETKKKIALRLIKLSQTINNSSSINFGAKYANGKYLILVNSNTKVVASNWIEEMLMYAQRTDVGAVGPKIYFSNGRIQHAGIIMSIGSNRVAGYAHYNLSGKDVGYMGRLHYAQNMSAVSAVCMMVRKSLFDQYSGFDVNLDLYNDLDFCLHLRKMGFLIVFTPYAELRYEKCFKEYWRKKGHFNKELGLFRKRWSYELTMGDPYYNPNLNSKRGDFQFL